MAAPELIDGIEGPHLHHDSSNPIIPDGWIGRDCPLGGIHYHPVALSASEDEIVNLDEGEAYPEYPDARAEWPLKDPRIVEVWWVDSTAKHGWNGLDDASKSGADMRVRTVGYLVGEYADRVTIVSSFAACDLIDNHQHIPRVAILSLRTLEITEPVTFHGTHSHEDDGRRSQFRDYEAGP